MLWTILEEVAALSALVSFVTMIALVGSAVGGV
jgi:hypothetical protein